MQSTKGSSIGPSNGVIAHGRTVALRVESPRVVGRKALEVAAHQRTPSALPWPPPGHPWSYLKIYKCDSVVDIEESTGVCAPPARRPWPGCPVRRGC